MGFLEKAWEEREDVVYKRLFGSLGAGIYPLDEKIFQENFKQENLDPRWFFYGVFKSPPNEKRDSWLYISSGMSNPWESEVREDYSGFGTEFVLETDKEVDWGVTVVRNLVAYNILLGHGRFGDYPLLNYGDRIPFSLIREGGEPIITHMLMMKPRHYDTSFQLMSGEVDFLHVMGITAVEYTYAKAHGSEALEKKLVDEGVYPFTNKNRETIACFD